MKEHLLLLITLLIPMGLQAQIHALNLSIELMDNQKLGSKAEIWVKGMGSRYLNNDYNPNDQVNKFGSVSTKTPYCDGICL